LLSEASNAALTC